jgi:Putative binding domain, N-terminal
MIQRFAAALFVLALAAACGQSTSPSSPSPTAGCAYDLSIGSTINGYPSGGSFSVAVTTTPATGCNWTAVSNASWIHVPDGSSATGTGAFTFTADADTGAARTGTLTVAGRLITFNQAAAAPTAPGQAVACTFSLSIGSTINGYPDGGKFTVAITATPPSQGVDCPWTASTAVSWIHIIDGASGSGNGAMTFTVDPNPGMERTAALMIATKTVTFDQSEQDGK